MDTSLFLEQFSHLAESPDGIQKLRSLILDLAVRGKLVPQNPDDEPASVLLERIEAEKQRLIKAGEIKKSDKLPPITDDEKPHELPIGWEWARLGDVGITNIGLTYSPRDISHQGLPVLRANNIQNGKLILSDLVRVDTELSERVLVKEGDLLICVRSGSRTLVGKVALIDTLQEITAFGAFMAIFRSRINTYLYYYIRSSLFRQSIAEVNTTTINQITQSNLRSTIAPVPPLAEQQRIVAKVDELMQLCDQLEAEQAQREHLHESAAKSTLFHLSSASSKSEAFHYWQHAEQHFPSLFDRVSTVEELRAAILQLAVQGRLVPQNPDDEPASVLLERLEAEKQRLIKAGEIKKSDKLPPITDDEKPYELPIGWEWVRLEQISKSVSDGDHQAPPKVSTGIPFLVISNIVKGFVDIQAASRFVTKEYYEALDNYRKPERGDILYTVTGSIGVPVIVNIDDKFCFQRHIGIIKTLSFTNISYIHIALNAPRIREISINTATGIAQKTIPLKALRLLPIPVPPLNEQTRIVSKVNELMSLCDQIEKEATESHELSAKLMDSILYHLFEPIPEK